jgi:hypothetical protein
LEVYCYGTGNVRLAIYSNDKSTLIAQGSSQVAVGGSAAWKGHTNLSGTLIGGVSYWLCVTFDNDSTYSMYDTGSNSYYQNGTDYTDSGFPASIVLDNAAGFDWSIRCGITPYEAPEDPTVWYYRTAATQGAVSGESWTLIPESGEFSSDGFAQLRVEVPEE